MRYKNIATGYIISTDCEIKADNWEPIPDQPASVSADDKSEKKKSVKKKETKNE